MMPTTKPALAILSLLVGASACAGAEMTRATSSGDEVGAHDSSGEDEGSQATTTDAPATTDPTHGPGTDDPTNVDGGSSDGATTDPTDASLTDAESSDGSSGAATDPSTSSSDGGSSSTGGGDTDTQGVDLVDLSGYTIVQANSAREFVIPDGTIVTTGTVIVIGRNASAATFQAFWGQNWGDEVLYFEGLDDFPTINGGETYAILDDGGVSVDGPSPALELSTVAARIDADLPGTDDAAWETSLFPNEDSTPGVAIGLGGATGVPYVSEYSDPTGAGNFDYEFVEIYVPA